MLLFSNFITEADGPFFLVPLSKKGQESRCIIL